MSKHDITPAEFAHRLARLRMAIGEAGLDWLLVLHPVSIRWLIGQDTKSYTVFQCLPVSAKPGKLVMFTRGTERSEFAADTMAEELRTLLAAAIAEDPMPAFARFLDEPRHPPRPRRHGGAGRLSAARPLRAGEGHAGRGPRPGTLGPRCGVARSEVARRDRLDPRGERHRGSGAAQAHRRGRRALPRSLELAAAAYHALLSNGSGLPASTMNLMPGERSAFALGGPTERRMRRGDTGLVEMGAARLRRYTRRWDARWDLGEGHRPGWCSCTMSSSRAPIGSPASRRRCATGCARSSPTKRRSATSPRRGSTATGCIRRSMAWRPASRLQGGRARTCSSGARTCLPRRHGGPPGRARGRPAGGGSRRAADRQRACRTETRRRDSVPHPTRF